jgi:hypothetical protein
MKSRFKCLAVICFSLMSLSISAPAQQSPAIKCPVVTVECPTNILGPGEPFTITANVTDIDPSLNLIYNWSVSAGTITGGQGTPTITLDTTGISGQTMTATVEVTGLDATCANTASCTRTHISDPAPMSRRFDKFGDLAFADEKKRLDYFAERLQNEPDSTASILVYGKQGARTPEAQARADRAKDYLVNKRGIAAERITTIDGGLRPRLQIELWLTPQGGTAPQPEEQDQ